ncbi:MAG: RNA polymerase sigma factor [Steroidobacteraceae bacterium]
MTDSIAKPAVRTGNTRFSIPAVERYGRELRRYLFRGLREPQDVDDLAQDVYMKLLRGGTDLQASKPLAFVYTVAARVLADHRTAAAQERSRLSFSDGDAAEESDRVTDALCSRLEESLSIQQQIDRAFTQMSPRHASVLLMIKRDGMSYEEVAVKLRSSVHAVHKYLQEGRAQLRRRRWEKEAE